MRITYVPILEGGKDVLSMEHDEFCDMVVKGMDVKQEIYEYIYPDSYVKPFLDLDLKGRNDETQSESFKVVKEKFISDFKSTEDDVVYSSAHGKDIWSYHIAIKNKRTKVSDLKNWYEQNESFLKQRGVDSKVYRQGKYRTPFSDKKVRGTWENRPFKIERGNNVLDHIISYTDSADEIISFDKKVNITKASRKEYRIEQNESGIDESETEESKEKNLKDEEYYEKEIIEEIINCGYLDSFNDSYDKWLNIGFMLANSQSDYYDLFYLFSKRSNKYTNDEEASIRSQWDKCKNSTYSGNKYTPKSIFKYIKKQNPSGFNLALNNVYNRLKDRNINSYITCLNTNDAVQFVFSHLKDTLKVSNGIMYYKHNNIWISNKETIRSIITSIILESNIKTITPNGEIVSYSQNLKIANDITSGLFNKITKDNTDNLLSSKFHSSTKHKICFNNGVLDFKTKKFTKWDDLEDEVYSLVCIPYNYSNSVSKKSYDEVLNFFVGMFEGEQYIKVLQFISRSISGNVEDKDWAIFQGNRDCGKGCLDTLLRETFHDYIKSISSSIFLSKSVTSGDEAKALSYLVPLEYARLVTTQECPISKGTILDGIKIKGFTSGGDYFQVRQNYKDEITIKIDAKLMMFQNDTPLMEPADAYETQHVFKTFQSFKKYEWIQMREKQLNEKIESGYPKSILSELDRYKVCDDTLKSEKIPSMEWRLSFIQILLDFYCNKKLTIYKPAMDDAPPSLTTEVFKYFNITKNMNDIMMNNEVEAICSKIKYASKNKVKDELLGLGVEKGKNSERKVVYKGLKPVIDDSPKSNECEL